MTTLQQLDEAHAIGVTCCRAVAGSKAQSLELPSLGTVYDSAIAPMGADDSTALFREVRK